MTKREIPPPPPPPPADYMGGNWIDGVLQTAVIIGIAAVVIALVLLVVLT